MLLIIFLFQIASFLQYIQAETSPHRCLLPSVCKHDKINSFWSTLGNDKITIGVRDGIKCDFYNGYQFELNPLYLLINKSEETKCSLIAGYGSLVQIKWSSDTFILDRNFNLSNMFHLFGYIFDSYSLNIVNLNGFDLNLMANDLNAKMLDQLICVGCKMRFYFNQKRINTCEDILVSNATAEIGSIFQLYKAFIMIPNVVLKDFINVNLINNQFISPLCPLVFNNTMIGTFTLNYLVNTFYKQNILTFSKLNSSKNIVKSEIKDLYLSKIQEIDLDSRFLNPLVFQKLNTIFVWGMVRNIEKEVFKSLENIKVFSFQSIDFRKIIHNSGIGWIKSINEDININMTNITHVYINKHKIKVIFLDCIYEIERVSIEDLFPEEDFCLYHDYPFDQLIFLVKSCDTKSDEEHKKFTCTFLWLAQYYKLYHMFSQDEMWLTIYRINYDFPILAVVTNPNYNSSLSNCFFSEND